MMQFAVLGSGSSGNSALVCLGKTRVLIDAGLSARQLQTRLEVLGVDPASIAAVVLTHEHGDHSGGLDVFCRKRPIPVYGTRDTCTVVAEGMKSRVPWQKFEAGQSFEVGGIVFESFSVPHDAVDPVGYVVRDPRTDARAGILSDVGQATTLIRERLKLVDTLFVEANYDEALLQNDTKRPWATKQRISSRHGHLSNDQAGELIVSVASERLHRVVLGHLSRDCNTPETACTAISEHLRRAGFVAVEVDCAPPHQPMPLRDVSRPRKAMEMESLIPFVAATETSAILRETADPEKGYQTRARRPQRERMDAGMSQAEWAF
jgi:phosphoribosyl 1,2-cyclic phosphodiesterase